MEIKSYEIVVARYNEDISWLLSLNKKWKITIYNKGSKIENVGTLTIHHSNVKIINIENKGREAETIAYHMLNQYSNYADLTVFIQADPFIHAPEMKELLEVLVNKTTMNPETEKYIPMTICYDEKKSRIPPPDVVAKRVNRFFHIEETSVYTLNCIYYNEVGVNDIAQPFRDFYKYPIYANIIRRFFDKLDCADKCLKPKQTTIQFNFSACFALPKYSLMQYSLEFYKKLHKFSYEHYRSPWILERTWLTIFDPEFDSSKILPEYTQNNTLNNLPNTIITNTLHNSFEIKNYEIVVARYNENIEWLFNINKKWNITIYNKGKPLNNIKEINTKYPKINIIDIENKGREAGTFAYHMCNRYDNYSDLTVFIQADPFLHAPDILELLEVLVNKTTMNPEFEKYIPMTTQYDYKKNIPPSNIIENRLNKFFHIDEASVYTLNCMLYNDFPVIYFGDEFKKYYKLPSYTNVIRTFFDKLGCANICLKEKQNTIQFNYAACFALPKYSLMKYTKEFYENMYKLSYKQSFMPWLFERTWLTIFDPEFDSSKILPEYSMPGPE